MRLGQHAARGARTGPPRMPLRPRTAAHTVRVREDRPTRRSERTAPHASDSNCRGPETRTPCPLNLLEPRTSLIPNSLLILKTAELQVRQ